MRTTGSRIVVLVLLFAGLMYAGVGPPNSANHSPGSLGTHDFVLCCRALGPACQANVHTCCPAGGTITACGIICEDGRRLVCRILEPDPIELTSAGPK